ncbi:MAG: hypothetical protein HGA70_06815 [Chlorobiaceae bacterium]|nr:hypothetical protein [Chlorobiaceae bacterium]NTW10551.1 hypothetical protein [Chlorobiaceae bacterium]
MPSEILELREKMNRFNEWEQSFSRKLTEKERFQQFNDLFELAMRFDTEVIERAHHEHMAPFALFARAIAMKRV